jgi:hypothetical protein
MARENFLWGAPRIHGELLMLGFSVSQASVSRYLRTGSRRPGQSWRTFLRNQAMAFGHHEYPEERSRADAGLNIESYQTQLERSGAARAATLWASLMRGLAQQQPTLKVAGISLRSAHCDRGVSHRSAFVSGGSRTALHERSASAFSIRSPPRQACDRDSRGRWPTRDVALMRSRAGLRHAGQYQANASNSAAKRAVAVSSRASMRMDFDRSALMLC